MGEIIRNATAKLNYSNVRPDQEAVIKGYLSGQDILFCILPSHERWEKFNI